eukprot:6873392-Karenia_brevis.AAC.1
MSVSCESGADLEKLFEQPFVLHHGWFGLAPGDPATKVEDLQKASVSCESSANLEGESGERIGLRQAG